MFNNSNKIGNVSYTAGEMTAKYVDYYTGEEISPSDIFRIRINTSNKNNLIAFYKDSTKKEITLNGQKIWKFLNISSFDLKDVNYSDPFNVIYRYKENMVRKVQYINIDTYELMKEEDFPCYVGDDYSVTFNGVPHYHLIFTDGDLTGKNHQNLTIKFYEKIDTYTATFDANGGTTDKLYTIDRVWKIPLGTLPETSRVGYFFDGWYTAKTGGDKISEKTSLDANTTFYAHWTPITYTISYKGNGNTSGSTASSTHTYDQKKALTSNGFAKTGYTFKGWSETANGSVKYTNKQEAVNLSSTDKDVITLYAVWSPNSYTVKYNGNNSTSGSMANSNYIYDRTYNLTANSFARTGYIYQGWSNSASGSVKYANKAQVKNLATSGTYNLYAIWKPITYTIKYNGNGNTSGSTASSTHTYDKAQGLTANGFAKTGHTFKGWSETANGSVKYTNKQSVKNLTNVNGKTINLYASWQINQYTATFNGNGGSNGSSITKNYGSQLGTLPGSSRTAYRFDGWYTAKTGGNKISNTTTMPAYNVTYYAHWTFVGSASVDVNPIIQNNKYYSGLSGFTFDVYQNGNKVASNVTDWNQSGLILGTKIKVVMHDRVGYNITANNNQEITLTELNKSYEMCPTWYDNIAPNDNNGGYFKVVDSYRTWNPSTNAYSTILSDFKVEAYVYDKGVGIDINTGSPSGMYMGNTNSQYWHRIGDGTTYYSDGTVDHSPMYGQDMGNGWYKFWTTFTSVQSGKTVTFRFSCKDRVGNERTFSFDRYIQLERIPAKQGSWSDWDDEETPNTLNSLSKNITLQNVTTKSINNSALNEIKEDNTVDDNVTANNKTIDSKTVKEQAKNIISENSTNIVENTANTNETKEQENIVNNKENTITDISSKNESDDLKDDTSKKIKEEDVVNAISNYIIQNSIVLENTTN